MAFECRPRRLLWIVNHKALVTAELPLLHHLGFEIFVPKIIPAPGPFRSGAVTWDYDATLTISRSALDVLNSHNFYSWQWPPTIRQITRTHFDVAIVTFTSFATPLAEAVRHFSGLVVARIYGREHPRTYADVLEHCGLTALLDEIAARESNFVLAQAYPNLAEIEPPVLKRRASTINLALPPATFQYADTWDGTAEASIMLCPQITRVGYYREIYESIKRDFGDLPHRIFGSQVEETPDPNILPYMTEAALFALYAGAPVFIYPSWEPRHIHYSPIEAMVVGTPVLYRRGALIDTLAGGVLPGACASTDEMREKARRLLARDGELAEAVRASQRTIVQTFSADLARERWARLLGAVP
jgi:hypothetical protein